jgi:hypothetical protein
MGGLLIETDEEDEEDEPVVGRLVWHLDGSRFRNDVRRVIG